MAAKEAEGMEKRLLGRTGERISIVGFGGGVVMDETPQDASRLVSKAIDRGINYFDVAPSYGNAEERLGPALKPYRQSVFLACKTEKHTAKEAMEDLHGSLRRLHTDHVDLYQFHAVNTRAQVEQIVGPNGAMEAFLEARDSGLIRYVGFSSHSEEAALLLLDRFAFDSILFPINFACWHQGNFGPRVLDKALQRGTGVLSIKALAKGPWAEGETRKWPKCWYKPIDDINEAAAALRFTLSKPVTATVPPAHAELLWLACDAADAFAATSEAGEQHTPQVQGSQAIFRTDG